MLNNVDLKVLDIANIFKFTYGLILDIVKLLLKFIMPNI